jgi:protocatechuate 3,4-dioxygenase beta subunit
MSDELLTACPRLLDRRQALTLFGAGGIALVAAACGGGGDSGNRAAATSTTTGATTSTTAATAAGTAASCALAPELTQGPYWLTDHPEASDLVQDREGTPLQLKLQVVDTACRIVSGAKVDIWHCDADGTYAGVGGSTGGGPGGPPGAGGGSAAATRTSSANWLQGWQTAGKDGSATFKTIYPGWYQGRAVHIHMKVFVGGSEVHTGQLFFPDDLSRSVFANAPYNGPQDTLNSRDNIFSSAGNAALITPTTSGNGYVATAQLVVKAT